MGNSHETAPARRCGVTAGPREQERVLPGKRALKETPGHEEPEEESGRAGSGPGSASRAPSAFNGPSFSPGAPLRGPPGARHHRKLGSPGCPGQWQERERPAPLASAMKRQNCGCLHPGLLPDSGGSPPGTSPEAPPAGRFPPARPGSLSGSPWKHFSKESLADKPHLRVCFLGT